MTQVELGHTAGFSSKAIGNIERGRAVPPLLTLWIIAKVLNVHPRALLFGIED